MRVGLGRLQRSSLWARGKEETGGRVRGIVGFVGMEEEEEEKRKMRRRRRRWRRKRRKAAGGWEETKGRKWQVKGICVHYVGSACKCVGTRVCATLHKNSCVCVHVHGWCIYMPAVYTDICLWLHVHGCMYKTMGMCVNLCLSLNRCQTQETRTNRK